jgi:hypothetical protein
MNNALKERYLLTILSGFTLKDGKLLVLKAFLIFKGMKDNSIESHICQARATKNGKWESEKINDGEKRINRRLTQSIVFEIN